MLKAIRYQIKTILEGAGIKDTRIFLFPTPDTPFLNQGIANAQIHCLSDRATPYAQMLEQGLALYQNQSRWQVRLAAPADEMDVLVENIKKQCVISDLVLREDPEQPESLVQNEVQLFYESTTFPFNVEVIAKDLQEAVMLFNAKTFTINPDL